MKLTRRLQCWLHRRLMVTARLAWRQRAGCCARRADARLASPRRRVCAASVQRLARMAEGASSPGLANFTKAPTCAQLGRCATGDRRGIGRPHCFDIAPLWPSRRRGRVSTLDGVRARVEYRSARRDGRYIAASYQPSERLNHRAGEQVISPAGAKSITPFSDRYNNHRSRSRPASAHSSWIREQRHNSIADNFCFSGHLFARAGVHFFAVAETTGQRR